MLSDVCSVICVLGMSVICLLECYVQCVSCAVCGFLLYDASVRCEIFPWCICVVGDMRGTWRFCVVWDVQCKCIFCCVLCLCGV